MQPQLNWLTNFIWGIADDVLRDLVKRGKYGDVILPIRLDHWQCSEPLNNRVLGFWTAEALQKLLQNQAGRDNRVSAIERFAQRNDLPGFAGAVAPERQRPNAGID